MAPVPVTVYHNPACSKSRAMVEALTVAGHAPTVIDFVRTGWTRETLTDLLRAMQASPRDILRSEAAIASSYAADDAVLDAMIADPSVVNRPIVRTSAGAVLARPPERALDLIARTEVAA